MRLSLVVFVILILAVASTCTAATIKLSPAGPKNGPKPKDPQPNMPPLIMAMILPESDLLRRLRYLLDQSSEKQKPDTGSKPNNRGKTRPSKQPWNW